MRRWTFEFVCFMAKPNKQQLPANNRNVMELNVMKGLILGRIKQLKTLGPVCGELNERIGSGLGEALSSVWGRLQYKQDIGGANELHC